MKTYDPVKVVVVFGANRIQGFATGTFITAQRNEDAFTLTVGADGGGARSKNANKSGTVELTLLGDSVSNDILAAVATTDEETSEGVAELMIKDLSGTALVEAGAAWVRKHANLERAKELGEVSWTIEALELKIFAGGIPA